MAIVERQQEETKGNKRAAKKAQRSRRAANGVQTSYLSVNYAAMLALIEAFAQNGGAVRFGFTRDAGAYAVGCYLGDDYATEYIRPNEDFFESVEEIASVWLPGGSGLFHQVYNSLYEVQNPR